MTARLSTHLALGGVDEPANLEHGPEIRVHAQLQVEGDRLASVGVKRDPVEHGCRSHPPLDADPQRLPRQFVVGRENQVGVREFERGRSAGGV